MHRHDTLDEQEARDNNDHVVPNHQRDIHDVQRDEHHRRDAGGNSVLCGIHNRRDTVLPRAQIPAAAHGAAERAHNVHEHPYADVIRNPQFDSPSVHAGDDVPRPVHARLPPLHREHAEHDFPRARKQRRVRRNVVPLQDVLYRVQRHVQRAHHLRHINRAALHVPAHEDKPVRASPQEPPDTAGA